MVKPTLSTSVDDSVPVNDVVWESNDSRNQIRIAIEY